MEDVESVWSQHVSSIDCPLKDTTFDLQVLETHEDHSYVREHDTEAS